LLNEFPFAYNFNISTDRVEVSQWVKQQRNNEKKL
jgi:hypothetical protein